MDRPCAAARATDSDTNIAVAGRNVDVQPPPPGRGTTITCRLPAKRPDKGNAGDDDA